MAARPPLSKRLVTTGGYATAALLIAAASPVVRRRPVHVATAKLPVIALGGITFDTASQSISCGAHGIAVIRAVLDAKPSRADALTRLLDTVYATLR